MDGFIQLGVAAATQAINDAGLTAHPDDADRIGVAIGSVSAALKPLKIPMLPWSRAGRAGYLLSLYPVW